MIVIHKLLGIKNQARPAKRVGRGTGSGKGKTAGRGTKGQKARGKVPSYFAGGGGRRNRLLKHLPYVKGVGNPKVSQKPFLISFDALAKHPQGEVTVESLVKYGICSEDDVLKRGIKISGEGDPRFSYILTVPATKAAIAKLGKPGGSLSTK